MISLVSLMFGWSVGKYVIGIFFRLDWAVVNIEGSLLRALVSVLFGYSLVKYVESLLGIIIVTIKVFVEGWIFDIAPVDINGSPLGSSIGLNGDIIARKDLGSIIGWKLEQDKVLLLRIYVASVWMVFKGDSYIIEGDEQEHHFDGCEVDKVGL